MMFNFIIVVSLGVICAQFGNRVSLAESVDLQQIHVILRHGERYPETHPRIIPNDPNMYESFYPSGSGGLTNNGKNRTFEFGKLLRHEFGDFLGKYYHPTEVYAVSTDMPRTKMTLQLALAGLYPPTEEQVWSDDLNWQPVETNYLEFKNSALFAGDKCDEYLEEFAKVLNYSEVKEVLTGYQAYFDNLATIVGKNKTLTLDDLYLLHINLECEKHLGLEMRPWMNEILKNGTLHKFRLYYQGVLKNYNTKLAKLYAGQLSRKIADDFINKIQGHGNSDKKIFLYSGHDTTIINVLTFLKVYELHLPQFSSAVIIKLLRKNTDYYVEVLHYLGIPAFLKKLTIPGCEESCPFEKFLKLTEDFRANRGDNCTISKSSYFDYDNER